MSWIRLDDQIAHHKKFLAAGPVASWLWICGQSFSARYLTDGFIPFCALSSLGSVRKAKPHVEKLVEVGLWERADGGYRIHDYHDYQPTAEEVRHTRQVRQEAGREGGKLAGRGRHKTGKPQANDRQNANGGIGSGLSHEQANDSPVPDPVPVPDPQIQKNGGAGAPRFPQAVENQAAEPEPDKPNTRLIAAVIRKEGLLDGDEDVTDADLAEHDADVAEQAKQSLAEFGIAYDSRHVAAAIDSERHKRKTGVGRGS